MRACCTHTYANADCGATVEYRHLAHLDAAYAHPYLRAMAATGRFVTSADARRAAVWDRGRDGLLRPRVQGTRWSFAMQPEQARLLAVSSVGLCVSGQAVDGRSGVFRVFGDEAVQITDRHDLIGIQPGARGPYIYLRRGKEHCEVILPDLSTPVAIAPSAVASPMLSGDLFIAERIGDVLYRYVVGAGGFKDWHPLLIPGGQEIVGMGRAKDAYVVGHRGSRGSFIEFLGRTASGIRREPIQLTGVLEQLWCSPNGLGLAWLECVTRADDSTRRLVVNDRVFHEGNFHMGRFALWWSPNEQHAVAAIATAPSGPARRVIILDPRAKTLPHGDEVTEVLVSNTGYAVCWIGHSGHGCSLTVPGERPSPYALAWNLVSRERGFAFNAVLADVLLCLERR